MRMAGRVLVLCLNKSGYLAGNMCIEGQRKNFEVHRLVCEAFHGPAPDGQQAAHKDGVRTNCYASNLRWATPASNTADRKSVVEGKSVSVRVDLGGSGLIKKKKKETNSERICDRTEIIQSKHKNVTVREVDK